MKMGGNYTEVYTDALYETSRGVTMYKCWRLTNLINLAQLHYIH